jgi:formylglycine-generating enzyme required for sulfatase activity
MRIAKTVIRSLAFMATLMSALVVSAGSNADTTAAKSYELPDLKMKLLRLEAGEFEMGSPSDEPNRQDNEFQHKVRLTKPFFIQTTPVTQAQYAAVMGHNPSYFHGDDLPVENVSWDDAVRFCVELGKRQGRTFRLPTEAEWEYAARAGKTGPVAGNRKPRGNGLVCEQFRPTASGRGEIVGRRHKQLLPASGGQRLRNPHRRNRQAQRLGTLRHAGKRVGMGGRLVLRGLFPRRCRRGRSARPRTIDSRFPRHARRVMGQRPA